MDKPKHGRVTTSLTKPDGSMLIDTESYYDGNTTMIRQEREESVMTDRANLLKDIIDGLLPITKSETRSLTLTVEIGRNDRMRLIKRWTTKLVDYARK